MKDKYIFLMGLGTGLVLSSILALFVYNILGSSKYETKSNSDIILETTIETTETINTENSTIEGQKTTEKTEISTQSMQMETEKPFELSTIKPFSLKEDSKNEQSFVEAD